MGSNTCSARLYGTARSTGSGDLVGYDRCVKTLAEDHLCLFCVKPLSPFVGQPSMLKHAFMRG